MIYRAFGMTLQTVGMVMALIALGFLPGCAATGTIAFGEDARATIWRPDCPQTGGSGNPSIETTERTEFDDKIGFNPQIESTEKTVKISEAPAAPVHESRGSPFLRPLADTIKAIGSAVGTAGGKAIVCVFTLGFRCGV